MRNKEESKTPKGRWKRQEMGRGTGKKILALFVWQQQAAEPQGHANERKAFQRGCRVGGVEAGVGSSHGYQTSRRRS